MSELWNNVIALAPQGELLDTKIDDAHGMRNHQILKRDGRLWFYPDGSMYVYYTPTHWRLPTASQLEEIARQENAKARQHAALAAAIRSGT